jgi:hypothetical protein
LAARQVGLSDPYVRDELCLTAAEPELADAVWRGLRPLLSTVRDALLGESQREPSGFSALRPRMVFAGGLLSQGLGDRPQSKLPDCTRGISDKRHGATCRFPSARLVFVSFNCIAQVASFLQVSKSTSSIRHAMLSRVGQRWKCRSGEKADQARQQFAVSCRATQHDHVTRSLRGGVVRVCPWRLRAGAAIDLSRIVTFPSTAKAHRLVALGQRKLDLASQDRLLDRLFAAYFQRDRREMETGFLEGRRDSRGKRLTEFWLKPFSAESCEKVSENFTHIRVPQPRVFYHIDLERQLLLAGFLLVHCQAPNKPWGETMKMMKRTIVALALAMGLIGNQAVAAMLRTSNVAIPIGQNVTLLNIDPSAPVGTIAGQMVFTLDAASTALNGGVDTIDAWCIDLFHVIYLGANAYDFTQGTFTAGTTTDNAPTPHLLTAATLDKMAGLMEVGNGVLQFGGLNGANAHYGIVGGTLEDWSAAVQLAIWHTEYVLNYTALSWGGGGTTANTLAIYNAIVADPTLTGNASDLLAVNGQQSFGYTTAKINLLGTPLPEPGSLALLGAALVGFGWLRRRGRSA